MKNIPRKRLMLILQNVQRVGKLPIKPPEILLSTAVLAMLIAAKEEVETK